VFKQFNLHAKISTILTNNLHWIIKIYFAALKEIYNNVGQQFKSLAIIQLHALNLIQKRGPYTETIDL
jgi:hypothetical protein